MRKRQMENPCGIYGHYHKYDEGEVCGVRGHRLKPREGVGAVARRERGLRKGARAAASSSVDAACPAGAAGDGGGAGGADPQRVRLLRAAGRGHLHAQIKAGLAALRVPEESGGAEDYARALLRSCDRDRDGLVSYDDFRRYIDSSSTSSSRPSTSSPTGCILPEELWHTLVKAGNSNAAPCSFLQVLPLA